jgi:hypothetical protein
VVAAELHGRAGANGLALLGHARARAEIVRDLRSWSRERRHCAVVAAGRARLAEARGELEAMAGRAGAADGEAVAEALARIGGASGP